MKDDRLYIEHIHESLTRIFEYTERGKEEFLSNKMVQDAVIRNFEIIGEATKQISDEVIEKYPDIPWSDMARFRDFLIHHYLGVDLKRVWNVIENHLPSLKSAIEDML